jgi:hypothetical protein
MRITVMLYLIVPRHPILQRIFFLIFPKSEPGQLQTIYATAWRMINQFLKLLQKTIYKTNIMALLNLYKSSVHHIHEINHELTS